MTKKDWLNAHPLIKNTIVVSFVAFAVYFATSMSYDKVVEVHEIRYAEEVRKNSEKTATINTLTESHKRLSKQVKTIRVVKPDGTIKEVTESNTESESQIRQQVKEEYQERITEEIKKVREEIRTTISERKKLKVMAGLHSDMRKFIMADYTFYGPYGINAGMVFSDINKPTYTLGLSWSF